MRVCTPLNLATLQALGFGQLWTQPEMLQQQTHKCAHSYNNWCDSVLSVTREYHGTNEQTCLLTWAATGSFCSNEPAMQSGTTADAAAQLRSICTNM